MKAHPYDYKKTVLINFPEEVTVGEVEEFLTQDTVDAKKRLVFVIFHRLNNRYIRPLNQIPSSTRSGFLMMAAACLLIESLQSFKEKREYTREKGAGKECFRNFFKENRDFHQLIPFYQAFYYNIRCGILHQAETYENWLVIRNKSAALFDSKTKAICADAFLIKLARSLRNYCCELSKADWNAKLWKNARFKLGTICEHCKGPLKDAKPELMYYI